MSFKECYTSCACNQTPTAAHWGKNNLICYGSCNSIRIYDPTWGSGGKIVKTLCSHSKRVNSVRWITGVDFETEIVSGSTDGTAVVWSYRDEEYVSFILKGHESIVNIVNGLYKQAGKKDAVVVTASVDCTVKVWTRKDVNDDFLQVQSISFGYGICMGLKMTFLPNSNVLIMACGTDDSKIRLYVEETNEPGNDNCKFITSEVLVGHENWVRGLDFALVEGGDLMLASSSQDATIRLWRISPIDNQIEVTQDSNKYDIILKRSKIKTKDVEYIVSLESILAGHEAWIYSISWNQKNFTLLSSSLDKSMIIWEFHAESRLWMEKIRVGEVGGNVLGFYGGMFGPDGSSILAHGYHGAFHIWNFCEETNIWEPAVTVGGHFNEVVDLSWEPKGEFLVSVSTDQTSRIHAPWSEGNKTTWHEIARPQVHGYDMSCLAMLSRYHYASGAEEKIIRTFSAPYNFINNFKKICKIKNDQEGGNVETGAKGAAVPSLGLSNKAVFANDNSDRATAKSNKDPYPEESHFTAVDLSKPPTEETLMQNTLWPEMQKLYGHGYEVYSLAASPDGLLLASACKSTTTEHAAILLWNTSTWKLIQKLQSHNLTVAQLAFSPDSKYLLSVSRDRRWTLFAKNSDTNSFQIIATTDKKTGIHTRIIWCCAWSHDSQYFATGSREGKIVVWMKNSNKQSEGVLGQFEPASQHLELKGESITALAFAPVQMLESYILAVGLESGVIMLYKWTTQEWKLYLTLENSVAHHLTVKRLAFRPVLGEAGADGNENILQLASCGSDHAVRIYNIDFTVVDT